MKNVFNTINTTFELNIPVESLNLILMADGESSEKDLFKNEKKVKALSRSS